MSFDLVAVLFTKEVAIIAAGIVAVLYFAGLLPVGKKRLGQTRAWSKLVPILPMLLGIGAVLMPGVIAMGEGQTLRTSWGTLVLLGVWAGLVASQGRKVFKRLILEKFEQAPKP